MTRRKTAFMAAFLLLLGTGCGKEQLEPSQLPKDAGALAPNPAPAEVPSRGGSLAPSQAPSDAGAMAAPNPPPADMQRRADANTDASVSDADAASPEMPGKVDASGPDAAPVGAPPAVIEAVTLMWREIPLAATLYLPADTKRPVPAVVTGPGFGGVKEMLIPDFAAAAAASGIATLAIDFAGFGGSGGMPRQHVDPTAQVEQTRVGLDRLATHSAIDPARLGVWGTSLSGGHALALAASDQRIRCVVAIIPFVGVSETAASADVIALAAADAAGRLAGQPGGTIPAVGKPGDVAVMTTDGAWEWSEAITKNAPSWRNEVTLASLLEMNAYTPAANAASIAVPVRAILATNDMITPAALARQALANVPNLDIVEKPDTHFELFRDRLDETIALTTEWLVKHL